MTPAHEHVVFVCTGNLCRSPMAEALLRRRLDEHGVEGVVVSSAGTRAAWSGATEVAVDVVEGMGARLRGHRTCRVDRGLVEASDLVVVMTADHVIDVVHEAPDAAGRVFKLAELERLTAQSPRRQGETLREYAARLAEHRSSKPWADSRDDADVADPMGESAEFYQRIASEIDGYLEAIVPRVWG